MKTSKGLANTVRILSTIAMLAVVLVSLTVYHANAVGLLIFFAFAVFYVLLPGLLITSDFPDDMGLAYARISYR